MQPNPALHPPIPRKADQAPDPESGKAVPEIGVTGRLDVAKLTLGGVPVGYDLNEPRTYLGHPAGRLARYMENMQALGAGRDRIWPTSCFDGFPRFFWDAFTLYDAVKSRIAKLFTPVSDKELGVKPKSGPFRRYRMGRLWEPMKDPEPRVIHSKPRKRVMWGVKPPTAKEWDVMDKALGFNVRGTSPSHIARQVKHLRGKQIAAARKARDITPAKKTVVIPHHSKRKPTEVVVRDYKRPDDLFAIWPPVELPKEPPVLEDIQKDLSFRPNEVRAGTPRKPGAFATKSVGWTPRSDIHHEYPPSSKERTKYAPRQREPP